ncbi:MAG: WHG domain-containing protein [Anaerolineales bacterium]|nr:WHG domain-containing protein [Anaerolineales bacterium]
MPYPSQVDIETLIDTARTLIEQSGVEQLTLQRLADEFGIKAPSLYKHVKNKTTLLQAVNTRTGALLVNTIQESLESASDDPIQRLLTMGRTYRDFALQYPATYSLLYGTLNPELRLDPQIAEALALPLQVEMMAIVGEANALAALRGAWALIHGFVMLELSQQFQRGGSLETVFEQALLAYLRGWLTPHAP